MSVYTDLADHISLTYDLRLPPHDEERAFVRIFRKLLSRKEAEVLLALSVKPRSALEVASLTGMQIDIMAEILYGAARKGIIAEFAEDGGETYKLLPFMPGIFESLGKSANDPEIAAWLDDYTGELAAYKKKNQDTVIHMNQKIEILTESMSIQEISSYLEHSRRFAVMDCICRSVQAARGNACGHSDCMFLKLSDRIREVVRYDSRVTIHQGQCIQCGKCIESCPGRFSIETWMELPLKLMRQDATSADCAAWSAPGRRFMFPESVHRNDSDLKQ